jgi:hypothetical protein
MADDPTPADVAAPDEVGTAEPEPEVSRETPPATGGSITSGPVEDGIASADEQRRSTIDALLREREGYRRRVIGAVKAEDKEHAQARVDNVDAELKRLGHVERAVQAPKTERATAKKG